MSVFLFCKKILCFRWEKVIPDSLIFKSFFPMESISETRRTPGNSWSYTEGGDLPD
jgi:hypothetical protein